MLCWQHCSLESRKNSSLEGLKIICEVFMPNHEPQCNHLNLCSICGKSSAMLKLFLGDLGLTQGFALESKFMEIILMF